MGYATSKKEQDIVTQIYQKHLGMRLIMQS